MTVRAKTPEPIANLDAEESVIGAMMLDPLAIDAAAEIIRPQDFYRDSHRVMFETAVAMRNDGVHVDPVTFADRLERDGALADVGGRARIHEIAALMPAATLTTRYATIVRDHAQLRTIAALGDNLVRQAHSRAPVADLAQEAEQSIFDLATGRVRSDFVPLRVPLGEAVDQMIAQADNPVDIVGVPSGFHDLDRLTNGFQPGNLIVVAGRPSMGKSGLAIGVSTHVALRMRLPVAFFTMEMTRHEIVRRVLSAEAMVEARKILTGRMDADEWRRVMDMAGRLQDAPLHLDDRGALTVGELRSKARRLKMRHPELALIVVDYLQLMAQEFDSSRRVNEIALISRSLKILAGELELPVLALSQLSRAVETRHDRRPILSDLRDSGAIEQDADLVIFIYRDEVYNPEDVESHGVAEFNLAKQRNGPIGTVKVAFVSRYARFTDLALPHVTAPPAYQEARA